MSNLFQIFKAVTKDKYNELSIRSKFRIWGIVVIIIFFILYSVGIILMHPKFDAYVNQSSEVLKPYSNYVIQTDIDYSGKNLQIATKTVTLRNVSYEEIRNRIIMAGFSAARPYYDKNKEIFEDTVNGVKITVEPSNDYVIVRFVYKFF